MRRAAATSQHATADGTTGTATGRGIVFGSSAVMGVCMCRMQVQLQQVVLLDGLLLARHLSPQLNQLTIDVFLSFSHGCSVSSFLCRHSRREASNLRLCRL
jgi:hypothetical protein